MSVRRQGGRNHRADLLAAVFAAIAIRIRVEDGGLVFFKQVRVGLNGQTFMVWKFRTMAMNAERLQANLTEQNEGNGALFKMRRDPRLTMPGPGCVATP